MRFRYSRGGIYDDNKALIQSVKTAQKEQAEAAAKAQTETTKETDQANHGEDVATVAPAGTQSEDEAQAAKKAPQISSELMQAMTDKSTVKKTLRGAALYEAFTSGNVAAFHAEKEKILKAYYALQMFGIQCNDVSELMVTIAYGGKSQESKLFDLGFKSALFKPESGHDISLADRYLDKDYKSESDYAARDDKLEPQLDKLTEDGAKGRTDYLEKFRSRLHGKGDPAWKTAKEGDIIIQFQAADEKVLDSKGNINEKKSYAEDQFRHVAVIVKIVDAKQLGENGVKSVIAGKTVKTMPKEEFKKLTQEEQDEVNARQNAEQKILTEQFEQYANRAYKENHRFACTMGASSDGVGIKHINKGWKVVSKDHLDWERKDLVWHDMDEDWYQKGIIRNGTTAATEKVQKVYLFK